MNKSLLLLLVDDEPMIVDIAEAALSEGGYEVLTAGNGAEAIALLESHSESLSGLITDIRLGSGPDGWDVARHARALNADVAIVYMTGDSGGDWTAAGVPKSVIVQKPFAAAQLVTAISTLLVAGDSTRG